MDKFNYFRKIEEHQFTNQGKSADFEDPWLKEAKAVEYPINGNSCTKGGNKFMRLAVCNRKVVETNGRAVYHIDKVVQPDRVVQPLAFKLNQEEVVK